MKKVWLIALSGLTRMARDRKALALLLLMPMILIGILGTALRPMMDSQEIQPFNVILVNADLPAKPPLPAELPPAMAAQLAAQLPAFHFGKLLDDEVLSSDQAKRVIRLRRVSDLTAAKQAVLDRSAVAVVYVPEQFTEEMLADKGSAIQLFSDPGRSSQSEIVMQIVGSFTEALTAEILAIHQQAATGNLAAIGDPQAVEQSARESALGELPEVVEKPSGAKNVKAFQYYAAAMALMFMLMTAIARAAVILEERQEGTLARMLTSPTGKSQILAGLILGNIIIVLAQFLILMLGTRFLYGVDWGNWLEALLLAGAYALAASGFGVAVAGLVSDAKAAGAAVGVVGNIFGALSGAMFPLYMFPPALKLVAKLIPNYWALQAFLDQMAGLGGLSHLLTPIAILTAMGLATGALGTWRLAAK